MSERLDWSGLIETALTVEGSLSTTYCRFYEYSLANCFLLYAQGARGPVATYKRWVELGRQVRKGERAKAILRPIMGKFETENGDEQVRLRGFKFVNCIFDVHQTDGEPLPEIPTRDWDRTRALGVLGIREVEYREVSGNIQGMSWNSDTLAISPVAAYPMKTTVHEMAHCVLEHSSKDFGYVEHRGLAEWEAEGSAYVVMNELELTDHFDAAESRAYIRGWLGSHNPDEHSIKRVFSASTKILRAGYEPRPAAEVAA